MIPVHQTILHDPDNGKHGNCLSAVLASLLHLDINDVPVFSSSSWQQELNTWLKPFNLAFVVANAGPLKDLGITDCYHELSGYTSRSETVLHAVVAKDQETIFDPMPDGNGLTSYDGNVGLFVSLKPWITAHSQYDPPTL